ncbi:helix-turn-helix domain-containing protein [Devosia sp. BSSL-BM10]|uniref:Helix-turn-helix domain-containing protein n=1 Tax=Devosia litorisediminis TaxID=2829817 RepID=A0A942EFC7_9HYPH|nr:helix-turn-helix domain-containing protein [Devosia litorisediminis]MBS3850204.1 helix-turn-helix domain-containing protein [Devosia litorisediminis]
MSALNVPWAPSSLTIMQAARYSGLSRSYFYKLFNAGLLPRLKAGKRVLILRADLDAYLESIKEVHKP